jgi:hypothetical protein
MGKTKNNRRKFTRNSKLEAAVRESIYYANVAATDMTTRVGASTAFKVELLGNILVGLPDDAIEMIATLVDEIPCTSQDSLTEQQLREDEEDLEDRERVQALRELEAYDAEMEKRLSRDEEDEGNEPYGDRW